MTKMHFVSPARAPGQQEIRPWIRVAAVVAILALSYAIADAVFGADPFAGMAAKASQFIDRLRR